MKVSMKWLKQYADIPVTPAEYESRMVMTGTGVEGVEPIAPELEGVVVGKVLTCRPHENSDHLHVCTVDVGEGEPLQIVCGAPNVTEGILVPVAKIGAPGGVTIKKGKLRGVESQGMLCSGPEIGVPVELYPSVGTAGLLVFREDHPLGADVKPIFGLDDTVIDFEILANRPDCLCVWGVARETAVAMNTELKLPEIKVTEAGGDIHDYAKVDVQESELCPRYAAKVIKNVRVGESPYWLRRFPLPRPRRTGSRAGWRGFQSRSPCHPGRRWASRPRLRGDPPGRTAGPPSPRRDTAPPARRFRGRSTACPGFRRPAACPS